MTLIERMQSEKLSATESHIVSYLLENGDRIADMSLEALAKETYTSNATIIRLCRKLGYDGYRAFKMAFVLESEMRKHEQTSVDFSAPFRELQNRDEVLTSMASLYKETIDICLNEIDTNEVERLAKAISEARRVYIFAKGDSMITARAFINRLIKLDIYPILTGDSDEEISHAYNSKPGDLALFVSYGLQIIPFRDAYEELRAGGTDIAVITARRDSPITRSAKYRIMIDDREDDHNIATFYSQLSFDFILNYLYSCLYRLNYSRNNARKSVIAKLRSKAFGR